MGKSLNGKGLGKGICNVRTVCIWQDLQIDLGKDITLDEWYDIWLSTCKKNCRNSTKETYATHYKRIKDELGWRKLSKLNLITMQEAINKLNSDNGRSNSNKILVDILNKALDSDLIVKNVAKQINTVITKEEKKRVLTREEIETFLSMAEGRFYYNLFELALETGMRIGELCALQWSDVALKGKALSVQHTLCYFCKDGKYVFEMHDTKTNNGKRVIPLIARAIFALKRQMVEKQEIMLAGKEPLSGYENLVFITRNNKPTQLFLVKECLGVTP